MLIVNLICHCSLRLLWGSRLVRVRVMREINEDCQTLLTPFFSSYWFSIEISVAGRDDAIKHRLEWWQIKCILTTNWTRAPYSVDNPVLSQVDIVFLGSPEILEKKVLRVLQVPKASQVLKVRARNIDEILINWWLWVLKKRTPPRGRTSQGQYHTTRQHTPVDSMKEISLIQKHTNI